MTEYNKNWRSSSEEQFIQLELTASEALQITNDALETQNVVYRILSLVHQEAELGNRKARYMDAGFDSIEYDKQHNKVISKLQMLGYSCSNGDYCLEVSW